MTHPPTVAAGTAPDGAAFRETQAFRQIWIQVIVLGIAVLAWVGFVIQIVLGHPFGDRPAPDFVMWIIAAAFGIGLPVFMYALRLVVTVTDRAVDIHFSPLRHRVIPFTEIASCEARTYRPIREYGGWGIRWAGSRGTAYNVSGNRGAQLVLANGKRVLIGSQRADELAAAIRPAAGGGGSAR